MHTHHRRERAFTVTLGSFRQWLFDERGLAARTRRQYSERVAYIDRLLLADGYRVKSCTAAELRAAYVQLPPTPSTRNSTRSALLAWYAFLRFAGVRADDPAATLPYIHKPRHLPRPYELEEVTLYRKAASELGPRYTLIGALGLDAGLRIHETAKAEWPDVGATDLRIRGKGSVDRLVPVSARLRDALRTWRPHSTSAQWILPGRRDQHVSTVAILGWHHEILEAAGLRTGEIGRDGYHRLRHTFATAALDAGDGDLMAVKELLGHASVATTQIYARLRTSRLAEIVDRLYADVS